MCLEVLSNVQTRGTNDNLSLNHPLLVILLHTILCTSMDTRFRMAQLKG